MVPHESGVDKELACDSFYYLLTHSYKRDKKWQKYFLVVVLVHRLIFAFALVMLHSKPWQQLLVIYLTCLAKLLLIAETLPRERGRNFKWVFSNSIVLSFMVMFFFFYFHKRFSNESIGYVAVTCCLLNCVLVSIHIYFAIKEAWNHWGWGRCCRSIDQLLCDRDKYTKIKNKKRRGKKGSKGSKKGLTDDKLAKQGNETTMEIAKDPPHQSSQALLLPTNLV